MKRIIILVSIVMATLFLMNSMCPDAEAFFFNKKLKKKIASLEDQLLEEQKESEAKTARLSAKLKEANNEIGAQANEIKELKDQLAKAEETAAKFDEQMSKAKELMDTQMQALIKEKEKNGIQICRIRI